MHDIVRYLDEADSLNAADYVASEAELKQVDMNLGPDALRNRGVPTSYLSVIEGIPDEGLKKTALSKFASLTLFLRSKHKEKNELKNWLNSGRLPEPTHDGATSMTYLAGLSKRILKLDSTISAIGLKLRKHSGKKKSTQASLQAESNLSERSARAATEKYRAENSFVQFLVETEAILGSGRRQ